MRRSGNKLPVPFLADSDCLAWMSGPLTTILVVTDYDDLDMFGGLDASSLPLRQQQILMTIRDLVAANGARRAHGRSETRLVCARRRRCPSTSRVSKRRASSVGERPWLGSWTCGRSS